MKRHSLLFLLVAFVAISNQIFAQCTPNPIYVSQGVGVYPGPDTASATLPLGCDLTLGLNSSPATVGQPYSFTFTAVVPPTVTVAGTTATLTSVTVTQITGLPPGMSYVCSPSNCVFPGNSTGCVLLTGTPTQAGCYPIQVTASVVVNLGFPLTLTQHFPSQTGDPLTIAGEYVVRVDCPASCPPNGLQNPSRIKGLLMQQVAPISAGQIANILIESDETRTLQFNVTSIVGKNVESKRVELNSGKNTIEFDTNGLPAGIYMYSVSDSKATVTKRLIVK